MRVVVVGHGMVGSRFVEELCARRGADAGSLDVVVLGAEDHDPYNRVLLSEVVAGTYDVASITMPCVDDPRVRVLRGVAAVDVDRASRVVTDAEGDRHPYDVLVLATGAAARVPTLPGVLRDACPGSREAQRARGEGSPGSAPGGATDPSALVPGAHVLRTVDDAREVVAASLNARRAVVLGGGVLGIEVAVGLAGRRSTPIDVTLVHPRGLMNAQLDASAGEAAADAVARLGVRVRTGVGAVSVTTRDGRIDSLVLDDGTVLPADLLVLTAGAQPDVALARAAGLGVERGVVIGADLSTDDPAVFAIGDCAQPPGGWSGLVAPGWEQARRLARTLLPGTGPGSAPGPGAEVTGAAGAVEGGPAACGAVCGAGGDRGSCAVARTEASCAAAEPACADDATHAVDTSAVVKVKGKGVDIVAMGVCGGSRPPACAAHPRRTVRLSDPDAGRYAEVVVQGGRVVGATCVGAAGVGADLVAAFTRGTPAPKDPAQLLLRVVGPVASSSNDSPVRLPDRTTICRCNGVTKGDLVRAWRDGDRTVDDVARTTRATTGCGTCADPVSSILTWLTTTTPDEPPVPAPAAAHAPAPTRT